MTVPVLHMDKRNALFQEITALRTNRTKRYAKRWTLVEGVRPLEAARAAGTRFEYLLFDGGKRLSGWAVDFLSQCCVRASIALSAELMDELCEREEGSELIGVANIPLRSPGDIPMRADGLWAALDRPSSPGNLGSIMRTLDAFCFDGLFIIGHAADPYDPQAVRASLGTVFSLPSCQMEGPEALTAWLNAAEDRDILIQAVGTSAKASRIIGAIELTLPTLLLFGNETWGLSKAMRAMCGELALIPIGGAASSLNLACAVSVCAYEAVRQRTGQI